jgi:hypothetical protein
MLGETSQKASALLLTCLLLLPWLLNSTLLAVNVSSWSALSLGALTSLASLTYLLRQTGKGKPDEPATNTTSGALLHPQELEPLCQTVAQQAQQITRHSRQVDGLLNAAIDQLRTRFTNLNRLIGRQIGIAASPTDRYSDTDPYAGDYRPAVPGPEQPAAGSSAQTLGAARAFPSTSRARPSGHRAPSNSICGPSRNTSATSCTTQSAGRPCTPARLISSKDRSPLP